MGKNEKTSERVATIAANLLRDPKSSPEVRTIAASALSQAPDKKKTIKRKSKK